MRALLPLVILEIMHGACTLAREDRLPEVKFLPDGHVTRASTHWLLSLKIDISPHGRQIGLLRQELDYFQESVRQQLAPYLDNDSNNHTDILLNSLYNVIESELAKFDIEVDMLSLLYKTIATSFLTPLSTGEDDVWSVVDDDGKSDEDAAAQIGDDVEGGKNRVWWRLLWFWWNHPQPSHWAAGAWKTCNSGISWSIN